MTERFSISLPGNDVFDARLGDRVLDSVYPSPKVNVLAKPLHAGLITIDWSASGVIVPRDTTRVIYSFPHNYGYVPTVIGAYTFDNGSRKVSGLLPFQIGALGMMLIDADNTNVNVKYFSLDIGSIPIPSFIMKIRFYVFAERGLE